MTGIAFYSRQNAAPVQRSTPGKNHNSLGPNRFHYSCMGVQFPPPPCNSHLRICRKWLFSLVILRFSEAFGEPSKGPNASLFSR
jgi:hypothetical protein